MKVTIKRGAVEFLPYENFSTERAMWLADHAKLRRDDGVFVITYHCTAANGIKKDVREFDEIPDGEYELPDKDWIIPETTGEDDDDE